MELKDEENNEKHILTGVIDRIDKNQENNSYEVIDYKTAKKIPTQNIVDQNLQMSVYHLGLIKRWPHLLAQDIKLSFYFLKHKEKISSLRSEEQLKNTEKFIIKTINEIKEKIKNNYNFQPISSALCNWCGYKQMCPLWKHKYQFQFLSQKDLEPIIKEYFGLKEQNQKNIERLNELRTKIFNFMDEQKVERVFGEKIYLTRKIQERFFYNLPEIEKILKSIGKLEEIVSIDEKKLEKAMSSLPNDIQKKILNFRSKKQISVLTFSKRNI